MTAVFLQNELQSIIQESKRKLPEARTAAEKSLADLKSLSVTSESQLSGDLVRKPHFIEPFVLACRSCNVKLATLGIGCLQRLAAGRAIPRERLSDVLDALREVASLSLDIQLKILQTLPSLLQLYSSDIRGRLLVAALEICDTLQGSKTAVVSSAAEATFQQLVTTVYDQVSIEDSQPPGEGSLPTQVGTETVTLGPAAYDAFRVFADLCALANATQPTFVQLKTSSPHFLLEVIGSIAANYSSILAQHSEQLEVCRSSLLPALDRLITSKSTFTVLVRALRVVHVLLRHHLRQMVLEFEDELVSMISLLEPNPGQPWRRVLTMEVFRGLFSDASLFRDLYRLYDDAEDRKNVVGDLLAAFVRIASEDPTLIGLGRQSTMPSRDGDAANGDGITSFEVSDIGGAVGGVVAANATVTGLSIEWSSMRVPCLEQLDKSNLSDIPTTYIFSLVLNCISALAEGISRFVMPLSMPGKVYIQRTKSAKSTEVETREGESRPGPARSMGTHIQSRLMNPLTISGHPQIEELSACARMIDDCWPPILATCSTFFNAALDADYYHNLVRAFQKLTQVSGVLELGTARDALLTTLSKAAVPSNTTARIFSPSLKQSGFAEEASAIESTSAYAPQSAGPREVGHARLSTRNLLCLRALLNLGIALGPSLGTDAWFIILHTLQRAEILISSASSLTIGDGAQTEERPTEQGGTRTLFGAEITSVQTATSRMIESTTSYTDETFELFVTSLFKLGPAQDEAGTSTDLLSPMSPIGTPPQAQMHRASRSYSALSTSPEKLAGDQEFIISKISQLARMNMHRFLSPDSTACSWQLLVQKLLDIFASQQASILNRSTSADEIDTIVLEVVQAFRHNEEDADANTASLKHCFDALIAQLQTIQDHRGSSEAGMSLRRESHAKLLGTLEVILGQCGDTLTNEWTDVLHLISSAFVLGEEEDASDASEEDHRVTPTTPRSEAILQRSFACLQLLVSDFLGTLKSQHLIELTSILFLFGAQTVVLNISLTATTFFWNVATLLLDSLRSTTTKSGSGEENGKSAVAEIRSTFLLLFFRMSLLSLDSRSDVRQSSTRMTVKVLEAASDELSPLALNTSISRLLELASIQVKRFEEGSHTTTLPWQEAAIQSLTGATDITIQTIRKIKTAKQFTDTWAAYTQLCKNMLEQGTLAMSRAAYEGLTKILLSLAEDDKEEQIQKSEEVLQICLDHHPADIDLGPESNQAALTQYAIAFATVFRMGSTSIAQPQKVVDAIERTVLECVHPPYTSDTKKLASEQAAVTELLPQLQRLLPGVTYTDLLQSFIKAPLARTETRTNATFVALAAYCSQALRGIVIDMYERGLETVDMVPMLETLSKLIAAKYTALPQGSSPPLWRNATTSAVHISQSAMKATTMSKDVSRVTAAFVSLTKPILQAGGLSTAHGLAITDDEDFDISSFSALHDAITPWIGDERVPTELLKSYMLTLFQASLVAEPFLLGLPGDLLEKPLEKFSSVRPGTVCEPIYAKRDRICYTALHTLFSLVTRNSDMRPDALRLAQAAAPYLLLRCAYAFQTFIADQPLRSISALPQQLRLELLTILGKCIELRSAKEAFMGIAKVDNSDGKAHLRLLNGLVVELEGVWRLLPRKATGVNWQDRKEGKEIEGALARWRACLVEGWGGLIIR